MKRVIPLLLVLLPFGASNAAEAPKVEIRTNLGAVVIELNPEKAPKTVENFLGYVNSGYYDGTIFHRVIKGFMNQGGGFTSSYQRKPTRPPVRNEADNGLLNDRGTIAMARTGDPHSATAQFFINTADNKFLNFSGYNMRGWGYAVFGRVVSGMEVMDRIASLPTGRGGPFPRDVPQQQVTIDNITVLAQPAAEK